MLKQELHDVDVTVARRQMQRRASLGRLMNLKEARVRLTAQSRCGHRSCQARVVTEQKSNRVDATVLTGEVEWRRSSKVAQRTVRAVLLQEHSRDAYL